MAVWDGRGRQTRHVCLQRNGSKLSHGAQGMYLAGHKAGGGASCGMFPLEKTCVCTDGFAYKIISRYLKSFTCLPSAATDRISQVLECF